MKKIIAGAAGICFVLGLTVGAMAVGPGKTVVYEEKTGNVTFDGKAHADKGLKCKDCHMAPKLFPMKKEKLTMAAMKEGKECGACHDGKKAFAVSECAKCHKK